jgi:hypothetical protein
MHFLFTFENPSDNTLFLSHFTFFTPILHLIKKFLCSVGAGFSKILKKDLEINLG